MKRERLELVWLDLKRNLHAAAAHMSLLWFLVAGILLASGLHYFQEYLTPQKPWPPWAVLVVVSIAAFWILAQKSPPTKAQIVADFKALLRESTRLSDLLKRAKAEGWPPVALESIHLDRAKVAQRLAEFDHIVRDEAPSSRTPQTKAEASPYLKGIIASRAEVGEVDLNLEERNAMLTQPPETWSPKIRQIVAQQQAELSEMRAKDMGDAWAKSNPL
jgi:hypothetical protein